MNIPYIPETAPFNPEQRAWLNGYLAGVLSGSMPTPSRPAAPSISKGSILYLFGSQTGTSEGLARRFAKESKNLGFETRAIGMDEYKSVDWAKEKCAVFICSTYGDGEMPDNAQAFWEAASSGNAPSLSHLKYGVLALGDKNYAQFCEAGKKWDAQLEKLGAQRVISMAECDVEYEASARAWFDTLMTALSGSTPQAPSASVASTEKLAAEPYTKTNPFPARLKTNRLLNGSGSSKETRHIEIVLEGSGLNYDVGDALGVVPSNCAELVSEILKMAGLDGEEEVTAPDGTKVALRYALLNKFDLSSFREKVPTPGISASELVGNLRKLQPRLYSISSSPKAHPGEVHLTVGIVRYELNGRKHKGVCSTFLADRVGPEVAVPVFVHKSPHFKLPTDGSKPIIMVGPGTGIAPFRAFLEERITVGATGKNWLFFGDQRQETDFLYREELEEMIKKGGLHGLDLAFSRDQEEKIYVQNRMMEKSSQLWAWLNDGAYFYVCGNAKKMAKDVDLALHQIAEKAGGLSPESALDFVKQLKAEKRYLRDVY